MDLTPYVEPLRRDLAVAAEAGGEDARVVAERLGAALESSVRLVLLGALSNAAGEITREMIPGSVEVRLRGLDPEFVLTPAPTEQSFGAADAAARSEDPPSWTASNDDVTARVNLRLPESLKNRIEEAAGRDGLSVNAWFVRALAATLETNPRSPGRRRPRGGQHYTGWVH
jgi:hypothetical protein